MRAEARRKEQLHHEPVGVMAISTWLPHIPIKASHANVLATTPDQEQVSEKEVERQEHYLVELLSHGCTSQGEARHCTPWKWTQASAQPPLTPSACSQAGLKGAKGMRGKGLLYTGRGIMKRTIWTMVPRCLPLSGTLYGETSRKGYYKPGWDTWQLLSDR